MRLTIFDVNGSEREWSRWLEVEDIRRATTDGFVKSNLYQGEGRFLVLVHLGGRLPDGDMKKAEYYDQCWKNLPEPHRVWWLFYSGGGYSDLESVVANIHHLNYPIADTVEMYVEDKTCFRRFLARLRSNDNLTAQNIWGELYPEGNQASATLLALLCAVAHMRGADRIIDDLLAKPGSLVAAHREYSARASENGMRSVASIEDWTAELSARRYADVRQQLEGVLGSVPD